MQLLSIADNMTDAEALLGGDAGNPNNGRQGVAGALRDHWREGGRVGQWCILTPRGMYNVFTGAPLASQNLPSDAERLVLFDAQRQYADRLSIFRCMHELRAPIVTMGHSIGYGPSAFRIQSDAFWKPVRGDVQIFPSSAARTASRSMERELLRLSGCSMRERKRVVVPYGINEPMAPPKDPPNFGDHGYLLTVGRLDPHDKFDFESYARAVGALVASGGPASAPAIVIAGKERDEASTAAIAQMFAKHAPGAQLLVMPDVSERDKWDLYWGARALVHPTNSHAESYGLTLGEGAAVGLPIIATDFSGQPEAIRGYSNAYWVKGAWRHDAFNEDVLVQYGFGVAGAVDAADLANGIRWSLSLGVGEREPRRFVDSALFAEKVVAVLDGALNSYASNPDPGGGVQVSRFADSFGGYWL